MPQVVIENPILNSPFEEPTRHSGSTTTGITDEIVDGRRVSSYFMPIPPPKKKGEQLSFDTEWTQDRIEENEFVNQIRERVGLWRQGGYAGVTADHAPPAGVLDRPRARDDSCSSARSRRWRRRSTSPRRPSKFGDALDRERAARRATTRPTRACSAMALKMATGAGKTVVMAMLIAWQALNKLGQPAGRAASPTRS